MKLFATAIFILAITACVKKSEDRLLQQTQGDRLACGSYGYKEGSDKFADCMMQKAAFREEVNATQRMLKCERARAKAADDTYRGGGAAHGFLKGIAKSLSVSTACKGL